MFEDRPHEFHALPLVVGGKPTEEADKKINFIRSPNVSFLILRARIFLRMNEALIL
jgi:hypothetical protein